MTNIDGINPLRLAGNKVVPRFTRAAAASGLITFNLKRKDVENYVDQTQNYIGASIVYRYFYVILRSFLGA